MNWAWEFGVVSDINPWRIFIVFFG